MTVERTVITCFIHEIKRKGYYIYFLTGLKSNNLVLNNMELRMGGVRRSLRRRNYGNEEERSSQNINNCKNIKELENALIGLNGHIKNTENEHDIIQHVTMTINHLLHFFMEKYLGIEDLCKLGQGIFDETMKKMSIDVEKANAGLDDIQDIPSLISKIKHDYFVKKEQFLSFDDYLGTKIQYIKDWSAGKLSNKEDVSKLMEILSKTPDAIESLINEYISHEAEEDEVEGEVEEEEQENF